MFLPGESQGRGSLVGCRLWGHTELDTTEVTSQQQQQDCFKCVFQGRGPVFLLIYCSHILSEHHLLGKLSFFVDLWCFSISSHLCDRGLTSVLPSVPWPVLLSQHQYRAVQVTVTSLFPNPLQPCPAYLPKPGLFLTLPCLL